MGHREQPARGATPTDFCPSTSVGVGSSFPHQRHVHCVKDAWRRISPKEGCQTTPVAPRRCMLSSWWLSAAGRRRGGAKLPCEMVGFWGRDSRRLPTLSPFFQLDGRADEDKMKPCAKPRSGPSPIRARVADYQGGGPSPRVCEAHGRAPNGSRSERRARTSSLCLNNGLQAVLLALHPHGVALGRHQEGEI